MTNLARKIDNVTDLAPGRAFEETGRVVVLREDGAVVVRTASGERVAERAVSCLVAPEAGDLVLVACTSGEGVFVLAVLRRDGAAGTRVALDGDLDLVLASGRLRVAAQEGVELCAARDVSVAAGGLHVTADEGKVVLRGLSFLGDVVRAEVDAVKVLASRFDAVLERVSQRVQRSYRSVAETDHVRAQRIDYAAEKTASVHGENTLVTADLLVKVDGEQIHMG
ncbi:MAG: DUF3540 domain-containing protein [Minicystis sp.]